MEILKVDLRKTKEQYRTLLGISIASSERDDPSTESTARDGGGLPELL